MASCADGSHADFRADCPHRAGRRDERRGCRPHSPCEKDRTLAWELDVIRTHGLDHKLDLAVEMIELASTEASKIALKGSSADLMLSDWLVARERSLGDGIVFYPRRARSAR
jgi:hypothetical protein